MTADEPVVIFSDQHKGARDGADDFQRCERGYNAALAYYHRLGYHLVELGDVEELWENSYEEVAKNYPTTLRLAAAFQKAGRYTRIFGNHDIAWKDTELFQELMGGHGYRDVVPIEALRLNIQSAADKSVVELFLAHGHQGTGTSDRFWRLSRFSVRHGWRRLQALVNRPWNTPSMDWKLRGEHAEDMASWARKRGLVLIAGHTHMPVFFESQNEPVLPGENGAAAAGGGRETETEALRLARAEWAKAELERLVHQQPIELKGPWYFNSGCCSYGDGDITGIEIRDDRIWLVRWACEPETEPEELANLELSKLAPPP
ncbi:MAG: hypothetical protein M3417_05730 [Actinomycetota bacterium]|nr:hypothetical protein [Actinomycetota bacterium]